MNGSFYLRDTHRKILEVLGGSDVITIHLKLVENSKLQILIRVLRDSITPEKVMTISLYGLEHRVESGV